MAGPFTTYVPPGVYVDTFADTTVATLAPGLRVAAFVGVSQEYLTLSNFELIRGSSATSDIRIVDQDVSDQFDGTNRVFTVDIFPIVTGSGLGTISNDPNTVLVKINAQPAQVVGVDGLNGEVTLGQIPAQGDTVVVSYYLARKDTKVTDDDLSGQADGTNKVFKTNFAPIVSGNGGGVITTDPVLVSVKVNGNPVAVTSVDGAHATITLATAPASNATVLATYYFNMWQDTFDYLPESIKVLKVNSVGDTPNRADYFLGQDFVIEGTHIQWGHSFSVGPGSTVGTTPFDDTQIGGTLIDNRYYARPAAGVVDGSNKKFTLEQIPTDGSGRGYPTDDVSKIIVYVGADVASAITAGPVVVTSLVGKTKTITLKNAPTSGNKVFATYYYNILTDDSFIATVTAVGQYSLESNNFGVCTDGAFALGDCIVSDPDFTTEGITFPNGVEDTQTLPGKAAAGEDVTLTFINALEYTVASSLGAEGSAGSGSVDQTYVDNKTGLRFTILSGSSVTYQAGDLLVLHTTPTFNVAATPIHAIPGLWTTVTNTNGVQTGDTALINTYNKSGNEPVVGDSYFVSLNYQKTDFSPKVLTNFRDVVAQFGPANVDNRLSLAAQIAFLNGAPAVALLQVLRGADGLQAPDSAFIEAIQSLENPLAGDIKPNFLVPLTTSKAVVQYAKKHVEKVSGSRYGQERTAVYGYAVGTTPEVAQAFAKGLSSERMLGIYPDGAIMALTDELGRTIEFTVDGSFLAAAYVGLATNPAFDVATPLTRKSLVGFSRLVRKLDAVQANQSATAGITILTENQAAMQIRQAMTTDPSNVLTREPSVIYIKDYVQQQTRAVLDPFIGTKFLLTRLTDIEIALSNMLKALVQAEIITAYANVSATPNANDPTVANVVAYYSPVFPLNWIKVDYTIRTRL